MLGKLIKHEFKHTGRYIIWMLLALVVVTPVSALYTKFYSENDYASLYIADSFDILSIIQAIVTITYTCTIIAVVVASAILLMYRFYKSMVTGEGYLTHTLPVSTTSIIFSKLFVAFVWILVCGILVICSIITFTIINVGLYDIDIPLILESLRNDGFTIFTAFLIILTIFLSIIQQITQLSASLAIGHRMNNHPILGSILTYIVFDFIMQIVSTIFMFFYIDYMFMPSVYSINETEQVMVSQIVNTPFTVLCITQFIFCAIYSFITVYMFKKKLNI